MVVVRGGDIQSVASPTLLSKRGSDCSGVNGANNRTLGIGVVTFNEIVFVQGAFLTPAVDYTKATVGAESVITFINKVYDTFYIRVYYWA